MGSFRYIDPDIRRSESMSKLTYRQRDLWLGLILTSDDQGRRLGNEALIRSDVWPYEDTSLAEITKDLSRLQELKFILIYQADGKKLIQIVNWHKYQKQAEWLSASKFKAPDGWVDRYRYHGKGNVIIKSDSWSVSKLPSQLPSDDKEGDKDVKGDKDGEEVHGDTSPVQIMLEKITGIPPSNAGDIKAMTDIEKMNPLQEDIQEAFNWVVGQGTNVHRYSSLVNPIKIQIAKRVQKPKSNLDQSLEAIRIFDMEASDAVV